MIAGPGADKVDAESFETTGLEAQNTHNTIRGGSGDDDVFAENGVQDSINCGTGSDYALVDDGVVVDRVANNCEDVLSNP